MVTAFLDDAGRLMVERVADRFGMSKSQLAETIGLAADTLYRPTRAGPART